MSTFQNKMRSVAQHLFWAGITVPQITLGKGGPAITNGPLRFGIKQSWVTMAQIGVRFLLVGTLCVAATIAFVSAYNWKNNESNEQKTYENKARLGAMMTVMTVCFILLALFRMWVPDLQALSL